MSVADRAISCAPSNCVSTLDPLMVSLPGLVFANAISSVSDLRGALLLPTNITHCTARLLMGAKSLTGSKFGLGDIQGFITMVASIPRYSVYPSGS